MTVSGAPPLFRFEAHHHLRALMRKGLTNYIALHESPKGALGLHTSNGSKQAMCNALSELLSTQGMGIAEKFVCSTMSEKDMIARLADELRNYMIVVEPSKSIFGEERKTYSGKVAGRQDDVAIALQLSVLTLQYFTKHDKYREYQVG